MNSAHLSIDVHYSNGAKKNRFSFTAGCLILEFEELKYSTTVVSALIVIKSLTYSLGL